MAGSHFVAQKSRKTCSLSHTSYGENKTRTFFQQFANVYRLTFEDLYPHSLRQFSATQKFSHCGIVVAQLVEQLLLTPEVRGSNPDISNFINCIK